MTMRVALLCHDKPDHLHVRTENRAAHLAHIEALGTGQFLDTFGNFVDGRADLFGFPARNAGHFGRQFIDGFLQ